MSNLSDAIAAYKIAYPKVKIRDKSTPLSISLDDEASCFEQLANLLLPNGIISGLGFALDISNNLIVQPGVWQIDRVQYNIATISTFALDAQDPTLSRYDVIYAGTDNQLHLLSGDLSADPIIPNIPDSSIQVCTALVAPTVITLGNPFPNDYVDLISNQAINGVKTFNRSPQVPNGVNPQDAVAFNQLATVLNASFANGVTSLGGNVFGLGGPLNKNTTITGGAFNLIFDGKVAVTAIPANPTDVLRLGDVVLADGVINGCNLSISGTTASIQPGRWRISNVIYQSTVVTNLTLDPQDATLSRFDVIYADTTNTFHVLSGVLSSSPDVPLIPAGTLEIAEILITPTSVTTTPTPPITNFVNTTTSQTGILGNKEWSGVQTYSNDVHLSANLYASAIPSGDVFSNNAGGDLILQAGLVYVSQPYRFNYLLPLGGTVGDYTIFANVVNFDSFNNARMTVILVNNPGDSSSNTSTSEYEFVLDYQVDPTKWYKIYPARRDGGSGTLDYSLEIQRSVNVDSAGIAYNYKLRVRRTMLDPNAMLSLAVWMESTPVYGITRAAVTGNDTVAPLNYYSAQISIVGQDIFDSSGNMFAKATGTFMPIAGGSFTGPVSFSADPTTSLGGATKQYVDNKIAATKVYFGPNTFIPGGPTFSDDPGTINNPYIFSATGINGQLLTGFASTTGVITGSDSILTSIEKLYGNQATYLPLSGGIMTGFLTLSADPTNASHAATKSYVDNFLTGITWKQEVKAATTANITLSGAQTIDGYSAAIGDRILVKNQTTAIGNGIYLVASGAWTRTTDADSGSEIGSATVLVRLGTINKDTQWTCTNSTDPVIGTDNITFGQIAGVGTYTNGTGILLSGNVFSLDTSYTNSLYVSSGVMTNLGDIIYGGVSGAATRLAGNVTTTQKFLTQTGNGSISAIPTYFDLFGSANTFSGVQTFSLTNLATTATDGLIIGTNTVATGGATQQYSAGINIFGYGWNSSGTPASHIMNFRIYNEPQTGSVDLAFLRFMAATNGGAYTNVFSLSTAGNFIVPSGSFTLNKGFIAAVSTDGIVMDGAATANSSPNPLQKSTRIRQQASIWNTKAAAAANFSAISFDMSGISSNAPVGKLAFYGGLSTTSTVTQTEIMDLFHYGALSLIPQAATINAWANNTETSATGAILNIGGATLTDGITAGSTTLTYAFGTSFSAPTFAATNTAVVYTNAATVHIGPAPAAGTNVTLTNALSLLVDGISTFSSAVTIAGNANLTNPILGAFNTTNIYTSSSQNLTGSLTAAWYAYDGSSSISMRSGFYGSTSGSITSGVSFANVIVGAAPFTTAASSVTPWASNLVVKKTGTATIGGSGSITNSTNLYIEGASAYAANNWSIYIAGNGSIGLAGSTSGVITLQTQAAAGTYNWNWPTTAGTSGFALTSGGGSTTAMTWTNIYGKPHNISTPTTGGTVNLTNNQYNIINPAGALLTLTINLPSSPANNDCVFIKFTQAVTTTLTFSGGTVGETIPLPIAGSLIILTYDTSSNTWY